MLSKIINKFKGKKQDGINFEMTVSDDNQLRDKIAPDSIEIKEDYVRSGSNFTRTLVCVDFEPLLSQEDISKLSELSETITIVQHMEIYDSGKVRTELSRSIEQNRAKLNEERLSASVKEDAIAQIESNQMLLRQLIRQKERMFMFQLLVHVVAPSKDELERVTNVVKNFFAPIGKLIFPVTRAKDAFDSFLPLNKNKVYDLTYRPMNSEAVSFFFPFHENEIFNDKGIIQGKNLDTNNIIIVNDEEYLNKHSVYIGTTGSGKSTAMFANMMRKYMFGNRIITIDPKGEFGQVYERLGGVWVKFSLEGGSIINPFDLPAHAYDEQSGDLKAKNPLYDKISTLITMFQLMYADMDDLEVDVLSEVILELYGRKNITIETDISNLNATDFPLMEDLYNLLEEKRKTDAEQYEILRNFHQTLRAYAVGTYSNVFNGYTNVDVNSKLISYDLFSVYNNKRLQKPLYFLLLSSLRDEIMNGDLEPTQLYIDEAHIIADPRVTVAMEYLYEMMKVVRSFNCGITSATQQIQDFLSAKDENRNYGDAVIALSVQQLILPMQRKEVMVVNDEMHYDFSESEIDFLEFQEVEKSAKAGKGFLFVGSRKVKIDVELTDLEKKLWLDKDYSVLEQNVI
ncbi:VirB4 family type IV secretion system protein [Thalassobacillus sp. B23F22_16]|uniref:VirB4 family type IV secretion system protein n=1 Tax=Thalassobacillus sp. B23F22_16 TaxID=3459513 RepID=UPI00373EEFC8